MGCLGKEKEKERKSLTSQESSLMSQSSLYSEQSQSELSIQSYNSLASVPSLGAEEGWSKAEYRYRYRYRCVATVEGGGHVVSLAAAGDVVYSGSSESGIRVWKGQMMKMMGQMMGKGAVKCIVVAGERVYSAHQDHRIRVWQRQRQRLRLVASLPTVMDYLMSVWLPRNHVRVRRHRRALWMEHVDSISALAVDGRGFLYSASWDRTVKVWRPSDFRCVDSFRAHDDAINALVVSGDGFLYTGSADARVKVWNKAPGDKRHSLVATLQRHKSSINALALSLSPSSGSLLLYSGACDRSIIVWEREESAQHMTVAGALRGHRRAVLCLASVGELVCSGSADKSVRVWRRGPGNSHSCVAVLDGHRGPIKAIAITLSLSLSPLPAYLVYTAGLDRHIKLWCLSPHSEDHILDSPSLCLDSFIKTN